MSEALEDVKKAMSVDPYIKELEGTTVLSNKYGYTMDMSNLPVSMIPSGYHGGPSCKLHRLGIWFRHWEAIESGSMKAIFREADRDFRVEDMLHLYMTDEEGVTVSRGTTKSLTCDWFGRITAITRGCHGMPEGYVMLSIKPERQLYMASNFRDAKNFHENEL